MDHLALPLERPMHAVVASSAQQDAETVPGRPVPLTDPASPTLADVMEFVTADPSVTIAQRGDRLCALRVLSRILGKDPRLIPASPGALRLAFRGVVPAAHGISASRWGSIRSRTLAALGQAGIPVMPGRSKTALTTAWANLASALPTPHATHGLSRFMRFCTDRAIRPEDVDNAVFDRFLMALQTDSVVKAPHRVHRTACDLWNKAGRTVPNWPATRVRLPQNERRYSFEWSDFPDSFVSDVEAFLCRSTASGPFADNYVRPQRPSTINLQRAQIRQMASLLVHSGVPIEQVDRLSTLAEPATAKTILLAAHKRLGDRARHLHSMALLLKVIAAHWCNATPEAVAKLARFASQAAPISRGMTAKNRQRLRQFDSPENVRALLDLPRRTFRTLKQAGHRDRPAALRALHALAVEFLIAMPMRIANLAALDLSRHVVKTRHGRNRVLHIVIPGTETKTGDPYEVTIPADTAALLETYRSLYLPLITATPTTLLFPNHLGTKRQETTFSGSLGDFVRREAGLIMNAHLFRHLAVSLYLRRHPEDLETARRLLGHKSLTTMRSYADIKTEASFRRYDAVIGTLRSQPLMRRST